MITLNEQIKEIERELGVRKRVYPNWVQYGKLSEKTADERIAILEAVLETLKSLDTDSGKQMRLL